MNKNEQQCVQCIEAEVFIFRCNMAKTLQLYGIGIKKFCIRQDSAKCKGGTSRSVKTATVAQGIQKKSCKKGGEQN